MTPSWSADWRCEYPVRVAILGAGQRSGYRYGPLIKALPQEVTLVELVRDTAPQIGIVSVSSMANGQVALMAEEVGLHVLAETPLAHRLCEADAIIAAANQRGRKSRSQSNSTADHWSRSN
jgi:predicted dehydrogenase